MDTNHISCHTKKDDIPYIVADPNEVIFNEYTLGKNQQKQLKLRNISKVPAIIEKLDINPKKIFQIKIKGKDWNRQSIAPGLCMVIFVKFLPTSLEEIQGIVTVKVHEGKEIMIKVAACRKHPILTTFMDTYHPQTHPDNAFDFGKCLVGSRITLEKNIKNIGGNGKFLLLNKNVIWNDLKKEELFCENNTLKTGPFSINPAAFSAEANSGIHFKCEFFPVKSGIHIENIIVASDTSDVQILTLTGEAFNYEQKMVFIKDSNKLLDLPTEENSEKIYFVDMGKLLPFTTKTKRIEVINNCNILFNYSWVSIEDSFAAQTQTQLSDSPKISWSIKSNKGELMNKINEFFSNIRMNDCAFGTFRHFFGLILEGVPLISLKNDEVSKMKTALGSLETQQEGFANILVEKVEIYAECVPLHLEIHPALLLQPKFIKCDQPFVNEISISNLNDIPVYYSWRSDGSNKLAVMEVEKHESGGIILEAKITPLEFCIPPHTTQKLFVTLQIKVHDDLISNYIISATFISRTWYMASTLSSEVNLYSKNKHNTCKNIRGPSLKFNFLGGIGDAKVKLCSRLDMPESFDDLIDFGRVSKNAVVQKKIFLQNDSDKSFVCQLMLLRNKKSSGKLMLTSNDPDNIFSVFPNLLDLDSNSHKEAILKFHSREEGSYCELIAAGVNGSLPGPSWDFALTSGKVIPPSLVIYPSTTKDTPYEIPKAWAGTSIPVQNVSLKNESSHPSLLAAFHWTDPILEDNSQLEVTIQPKSGMIRAQESISFSMNVLIKSRKVKQFILPCFIGQNNDPLLVYFKCDVESLAICVYLPKDEMDEILNSSELLAMGLSEDDLIANDKKVETEIWNVEFNLGSAITFKGVSTYRVEVREICIENKSPFEMNYECGLKNFSGKVEVQNFGRWKCPVEDHRSTCSYLEFSQSRNTMVLELKQNRGKLSPWEKSIIEVWLLGSTWGVYYDEIMVKFDCAGWIGKEMYLQPPSLKIICISQIVSHPLHFPAMINYENKILRFGTSSRQNHKRQRTVYIRNTSCLDIIVVWNVHSKLKNNNIQCFQLGIHHFDNNIFKYIREMAEKIEHEKFLIKDHNTSEMLNQIESFILKQIGINSEDISTEMAILPLIGPINEDVFKVSQRVTIIPPHSERRLIITFNCGDYSQSHKSFQGTLVGYVHISPENSSSSQLFIRPDGTKLNPLLLTLVANQTIPELLFRHDKDKSTIRLNVLNYLAKNSQGSQGVLTSFKKSIIIENKSNGVANFQIKVDDPLILIVKDGTDVRVKRRNQNASEFVIQPEMELEIVVMYEIERKELDSILEFVKNLNNETSLIKLPPMLESAVTADDETKVTIERKITISHDEYEMEVIPLKIVYVFPSVTVSHKKVNFGSVMINTSIENEIKIQNNTAEAVKFRTSISQKTKVFSVKPRECLLHGIKDYADSFATVHVKFNPKSSGYFTGVLLISLEGGVKDMPIHLSGSGFEEV